MHRTLPARVAAAVRGAVVILACSTLPLAAAQGADLTVNDRGLGPEVIEVDGRAYVPIDVLRDAGMIVAPLDGGWELAFGPPITGGADQLRALEGCTGTLLFNGVWRFQVERFERYVERSLRGWDVHVEIRNGTDRTLAPRDLGFHPLHDGIVLVLESGRVLSMGTGYVGQIQQQLLFRQIPPGASAATVFRFLDDGDDTDPVRLVVPVSADIATFRSDGLSFETDAPSYRIRLDCE